LICVRFAWLSVAIKKRTETRFGMNRCPVTHAVKDRVQLLPYRPVRTAMPDARRYLLYKLNSPDLHRTSRVRPDLAGRRWRGCVCTGRRACRVGTRLTQSATPQITAWPADTGTRTVCAVTALASLKFSEALYPSAWLPSPSLPAGRSGLHRARPRRARPLQHHGRPGELTSSPAASIPRCPTATAPLTAALRRISALGRRDFPDRHRMTRRPVREHPSHHIRGLRARLKPVCTAAPGAINPYSDAVPPPTAGTHTATR
jgi:hypothetical protein